MAYEAVERPNKRECQRTMVQHLLELKPEQYEKGDVLILSGPSPVDAVLQYLDSDLVGHYMLVEQEGRTFRKAFSQLSALEKATSANCWIYHDDVERLLRSSTNVSGLDLDLCMTLNLDNRKKLQRMLEYMVMKNDLCCFWLRVTCSTRGIGEEKTNRIIHKAVENALQDSPWELGTVVRYSYMDAAPMYSWQAYIYIPEVSYSPPLRDTSTYEPCEPCDVMDERTTKHMPLREKEEFERYVEEHRDEETNKDIACRFGVTTMTVAAMRAKITRKEQGCVHRKRYPDITKLICYSCRKVFDAMPGCQYMDRVYCSSACERLGGPPKFVPPPPVPPEPKKPKSAAHERLRVWREVYRKENPDGQ